MQRALHDARLPIGSPVIPECGVVETLVHWRPLGPGVKRSMVGAAAAVGAVGAEVGERVGAKVSWAIVPPASSTKQAAGASIVHSVGIVCKVRRGGAKGES